jgi:hypothetical protein
MRCAAAAMAQHTAAAAPRNGSMRGGGGCTWSFTERSYLGRDLLSCVFVFVKLVFSVP